MMTGLGEPKRCREAREPTADHANRFLTHRMSRHHFSKGVQV